MNKSLIYSCVWGCITLLFISINMHAQSTIHIGYIGGYYQSEHFNTLSADWSAENAAFSELSNLGFSSGVDVGFRHKTASLGWTLSYSLGLGGSSTLVDMGDKLDVRFLHHMMSGGLETHLDRLALGTSIVYNRLHFNVEQGSDIDESLDRLRYWSSRLYLSYLLTNRGQQRIALEPFVDIPWSSGDPLTEPAQFLGVDANNDSSTPFIFGLRVMLVNGQF